MTSFFPVSVLISNFVGLKAKVETDTGLGQGLGFGLGRVGIDYSSAR